jgi:hypothetical protein
MNSKTDSSYKPMFSKHGLKTVAIVALAFAVVVGIFMFVALASG